jgi:hypothetical protein
VRRSGGIGERRLVQLDHSLVRLDGAGGRAWMMSTGMAFLADACHRGVQRRGEKTRRQGVESRRAVSSYRAI